MPFRQVLDFAMVLDVKTKCLGILTRSQASGYEIQKLFSDEAIGNFAEASYGSIYPALTRLTEEGLVLCEEHQQDGRPDKKVYSITPAGRDAFREALGQFPTKDKFRSEFLFFLLFADQMEGTHLADLIDLKFEEIQVVLAQLSEGQDGETRGERFVRGYGRVVHEAIAKYIKNNRHLIEDPVDEKVDNKAI